MLRRLFKDPVVNWAAAFQISFIGSVTLWKVAANALLISRTEAESLPIMYMLSALLTGLLAMRAVRRTSRRRTAPPGVLMPWAAGLSLGFFLLLPRLGVVGLSAVYLSAEAYATLVSLGFWEAMGNTFNARQARRLFTLLGAAGMVGAMLGGVLSPAVSMLGVGWLLPTGGVLALAAAFSARRFARLAPSPPSAVPGGVPARLPEQRRQEAMDYVRSNPYPQGMALCALLLALLMAIVDYHFRRRAGELLNEREMAALFGWVNLAVGISAVTIQLGLSQRILSRFGIFRYLMMPPLGVAISAGISLFAPGLWPVFTEKTIENAGSFSITQSTFQLLYSPIPPEYSGVVRGFVDGLMKKVGFALGGITLLLLGTQVSDRTLTIFALLTGVACAVALTRQKGLYIKALARRISLDPEEPILQGRLDADARRLLMKELTSPESHRVLNALELLRHDQRFDVGPFLLGFLDHPSERVREAGVGLARRTRATAVAPRLIAMAEGAGDRRPRDEAVRALAAVLPEPEAIRRLRLFLDRPDPGLRAAATEALYHLGSEGRAVAEKALESALVGTSSEERRESARLLGRLRTPDAAKRLLAHFEDSDILVRIATCNAAAELRDPMLVEPLFGLMSFKGTRPAAREALIAFGDLSLEPARRRLDDRSQPLALRLEMPKLLCAIGSEQAAEVLLFSNIDDDAFLRHRIGLALERWRSQNPTLAVDRTRIRQAIDRRIAGYNDHAPIFRDVRAGLGPQALLSRALAGRLEQNVEIIFQLLGLIYPQRMLKTAHRRLATGEPRERAQALELVDSLLDSEFRLDVMHVLEAELARRWGDEPGGDKGRLEERLEQLLQSDDTMLQALAQAALPRRPDAEGDAILATLGLERVLLLEGVDIFEDCSVDDLTALAHIAGERQFAEGERIYSEGEPGETLFVLVEGRVRILKKGRIVLRLGAREAFGSVSMLDGAPRPADAVADAPVRALAIDRADFLDLVSDRPELLKGVFNVVTGQLRKMIEVAAQANATAA